MNEVEIWNPRQNDIRIEWKAHFMIFFVKDGSGANIRVYPLVGGNKEPAMLNLK